MNVIEAIQEQKGMLDKIEDLKKVLLLERVSITKKAKTKAQKRNFCDRKKCFKRCIKAV